MNRIIFITFLTIAWIGLYSQDGTYNRVKIQLSEGVLDALAHEGFTLEGEITRDHCLITEISGPQTRFLEQQDFNFEVMVQDVTSFYQKRNTQFSDLKIERNPSDEWIVPAGWGYGSMGGFYTFEQMLAELDTMIMLYPGLITPVQQMDITSTEGRPIYWVKISDNPNVDEEEPEVMYTALHHAREPISLQQMIFYMYYLLENYETNEEIEYLVNTTEMYFVPCLNPDGYVYNQTTYPGGGGMWRKNRRDNGGSYGVDINRNYGYKWGYDNNGSSPDPEDDTYRGPEAFSEPEIQATRQFCIDRDFKMALNYHSYSNLLLYTWGWTSDPCPDDDILEAYAVMMTAENGYTYGPGSTTIYPTNGGSDDWMYGDTLDKPRFFSYTPEVGNSNDGFWPSINRIIPLCQENMHQNIMAAKLVGKYASAKDEMPYVIGNKQGYLKFSIERLGLTNAGFTVSVIPVSGFSDIGGPVSFQDLEILESVADSISYTLEESLQVGDSFSYIIAVNNGDITEYIDVVKLYGQTTVVFEEYGNDLNNWSGTWALTGSDYISAPYAITDSPNGNYSNNTNKSLILGQYIDLENTIYAELSFWAKWEIENGYDYVQVLVSTGTNNWYPLQGNYTHPGSEYQEPGEPVFDGVMNNWVRETMSLNEYLGGSIRLRFNLTSDSYITGDGFYFDDLQVSVIDELTNVEENLQQNHALLAAPYPNPANKTINFLLNTSLSGPNGIMEVYNASGSIVHRVNLDGHSGKYVMDIHNWNPGVYFYRITGNYLNGTEGKLIVL